MFYLAAGGEVKYKYSESLLKHMLVDLKDINVKKLSEIYDHGSRESFVSLYMNTEKTNERFVEKRKKACSSVLKENRELKENFDKTMQKIEKYLSTNDRERGQKGFAIFASNEHDLFKSYKLGMPVEDLLVVDTSPYIRPLAKLIEDYETFGLVVLDNHRSRIYVVSLGRIEGKDKIAKDIMKTHKKGGMSQARFQRLRLGAIEHFMKEVSEEMEKLFSKENVVKIVIAGPGNAKKMLKDFLPNDLKLEILDLIDVDFDKVDGYLVSKAEEIIHEDEKETFSKKVVRLKDEILKNGLAVNGLEDMIDAVKNGQIELLLVSNGNRLRGWICEKCQLIDSGIIDKCPNCSGKVSEVDVIEEIIEFAERKGTKIEFVDDNPILHDLGGVGGLLRFKIKDKYPGLRYYPGYLPNISSINLQEKLWDMRTLQRWRLFKQCLELHFLVSSEEFHSDSVTDFMFTERFDKVSNVIYLYFIHPD